MVECRYDGAYAVNVSGSLFIDFIRL